MGTTGTVPWLGPLPGQGWCSTEPLWALEQGEVLGCHRASVNERSKCYVNLLSAFTPMNQIRSGAFYFIIIFFLFTLSLSISAQILFSFLPFPFIEQHSSGDIVLHGRSQSKAQMGARLHLSPFPTFSSFFVVLHPLVKRKNCSRQQVGACLVLSCVIHVKVLRGL